MIKLVSLATAVLLSTIPLAQERSPQAVVDELLAADRAFSESSAKTDSRLGPRRHVRRGRDDDGSGKLVQGKAAVMEALRANPDNLKSHLQWTVKRGGISADGQHGFTFGFLVTEGADGKKSPGRYLAYWVKGAGGWHVAVYKRARAAGDAPVSSEMMAPSLPAKLVAPSTDAAATRRFGESLAAAEGAFSKDAQSVGLGPAFVKYGSADAINLGGPSVPGLVVGNEAIGKFIGANSPEPKSPLSWGADRVIVASSGDLGVTIGTIRQNAPAAGEPASFPFFTIWHRASPADPWKYIAE